MPPQASTPPASEANKATAASLPEPKPDPRLIPLYDPAEVLGSLPRGRQDPFAPPPEALVAAADTDSDGGDEDGAVQLTGVSSTGGVVRAFVSYGGHSGPVALGDQGGPGLPWLPAGVSVAAVDVQRGQLLLERDGRPLSPLQL